MARKKLVSLFLFLVLSKSYTDSSVIYSAYLRSEIRRTMSNIPEKGFYSTLGKSVSKFLESHLRVFLRAQKPKLH